MIAPLYFLEGGQPESDPNQDYDTAARAQPDV